MTGDLDPLLLCSCYPTKDNKIENKETQGPIIPLQSKTNLGCVNGKTVQYLSSWSLSHGNITLTFGLFFAVADT